MAGGLSDFGSSSRGEPDLNGAVVPAVVAGYVGLYAVAGGASDFGSGSRAVVDLKAAAPAAPLKPAGAWGS